MDIKKIRKPREWAVGIDKKGNIVATQALWFYDPELIKLKRNKVVEWKRVIEIDPSASQT